MGKVVHERWIPILKLFYGRAFACESLRFQVILCIVIFCNAKKNTLGDNVKVKRAVI